MSDIRFNQWLHQSGTGGITQVDGGHVGIGTTNPDVAVHSGNTKKINVGIVTANSVYAGSLYGDGSNLTSLPAQATIANNADNRVITGGSGVNLNGESNVVINGGKLGIGVASPNQLIEVHGASNPAVLVQDTTNNCISYMYSQDSVATFGSASNHPVVFNVNNSEKLRIDSDGRLLIGTTSHQAAYGTSALQIAGTSGATSSMSLIRHGNSPYLTLGSSGGSSLGAVTALSSGDRIGQLTFAGADGTDINTHAASIAAYVDGSVSSNNVPARIVFATGPSETERLRIDSSGRVLIGNSSTNTQKIGDGTLQVFTSDRKHPAIRTNAGNANGYTMFSDA